MVDILEVHICQKKRAVVRCNRPQFTVGDLHVGMKCKIAVVLRNQNMKNIKIYRGIYYSRYSNISWCLLLFAYEISSRIAIFLQGRMSVDILALSIHCIFS